MVEDGRPLVNVPIDLDLKINAVIDFYGDDYLWLDRVLDLMVVIFNVLQYDWATTFFRLYR